MSSYSQALPASQSVKKWQLFSEVRNDHFNYKKLICKLVLKKEIGHLLSGNMADCTNTDRDTACMSLVALLFSATKSIANILFSQAAWLGWPFLQGWHDDRDFCTAETHAVTMLFIAALCLSSGEAHQPDPDARVTFQQLWPDFGETLGRGWKILLPGLVASRRTWIRLNKIQTGIGGLFLLLLPALEWNLIATVSCLPTGPVQRWVSR